MKKEYQKLVRDRIPEIIIENGEEPTTRSLDDDEFREALEKKLFEEYKEVISASGEDRLEELADLLEVASSLAKLEGSNMEEVMEIAKKKAEKRGGFDQKIFLESVMTKED